MLAGDEFDIVVDVQTGRYKIHVKCIYSSSQIYRFTISAGEKIIQLRTDFPFVYFQKKRSKPASWKIELGDKPSSGSAFFKMIEEIEVYLKKNLS